MSNLIEPPIRKASKKHFLRSIAKSRPPQQWGGKSTARERRRLAQDFVNLQSQLKAEAMSSFPREFRNIFQKQLNIFKDEALVLGARAGLGSKAGPDESWSAEEIALVIVVLKEASNIAFFRGKPLSSMARSKYQSLIDRAYGRSLFLLGEADGLMNPRLASRNEKLLSNLELVSRSSMNMVNFRIEREVERTALLSRDTSWANIVNRVVDSAKERIQIPSRLTTIARTEGGRAVDEGMKEAFKQSEIITHCSVVGCMAVEPNIPTYNGVPTCNIEDVPVVDVDDVEFHINHTGAWVASKFVE
jgi:hypothetical protein